MKTEQFAIRAEGLKKTYSLGKDSVEAVKGVDLQILPHTIYALLGPNGAGKTTLLSMLTTLIQPTGGIAEVAGFDVTRDPDLIRRRIGVTFQEIVLEDDLTGREILDYHGRLYRMDKQTRQRRIDALLELVELQDASERIVKTYSGGMKRRLELIRGLLTDPEILFLDEPTLGLDPQNRANLWSYIRNLRDEKGLTLLLTTHYMDEAEALADQVGIIDQGQLAIQGRPQDLIDEMGADVINVTGNGDIAPYVQRLRGQEFVQGLNAAERLIQIGVDNGNRRLADIVTLASGNGFHIEDIGIAKPTLGDVFLKHTGRQLRDH